MLVASFVKHWQQNFLVSIVFLFVTIILFIFLYNYLDRKMVTKESEFTADNKFPIKEKAPMIPLMMSSGLIVFLVLCLLRVSIDNGIKMMTPVMLMESYKELSAALATRISSVLIVFSAVGTFVSGLMKSKITGNEIKAQIIFYIASVFSLLAVCFVGKISYIWILTALCVAVMLVHGTAPFNLLHR